MLILLLRLLLLRLICYFFLTKILQSLILNIIIIFYRRLRRILKRIRQLLTIISLQRTYIIIRYISFAFILRTILIIQTIYKVIILLFSTLFLRIIRILNRIFSMNSISTNPLTSILLQLQLHLLQNSLLLLYIAPTIFSLTTRTSTTIPPLNRILLLYLLLLL